MKKTKKAFEMHDDYYGDVASSLLDGAALKGEGPEAGSASLGLVEHMDQVVKGISGMQSGGQIYLVDIRQLEPYPDQPFRQYTPERLQELADDIKKVGVLSPILVRMKKNKLQILAGHNRWQAAKLAGLSQVPVIVLDADDDQAVLVLTSTNLRQREHLLPSEKAFAYKMQMDALRRQGQKAGDSVGAYDASSFITRQTGDSRMQIHRFTRLTELDPGLLELLDRGKISLTPAVSISYLDANAQKEVLRCIKELGAGLTIEKAGKLRELAGRLSKGEDISPAIREVLFEQRPRKNAVRNRPGEVSIRLDKIREFLPEGIGEEDVEEWIVEALSRLG